MSFFPVVHRPSESASASASRDASALDLSSPHSPRQPSSPLKYSSGNADRSKSDGQGRRESEAVKDKKAHKEYGSDLEMLGRALCAERGWDALVSRRGRGCLACAVREAGALGWRGILRVA